MREKDGDNMKRGNFCLSLRFRSIHLSSFDLSEEDADNLSSPPILLSVRGFISFFRINPAVRTFFVFPHKSGFSTGV